MVNVAKWPKRNVFPNSLTYLINSLSPAVLFSLLMQNNITLNVVARDLAAGDNKDFSNLNTAQQNEYFTKAGNYVSDMIKNDPAQLAQYNSQYGAQSIVSPNNTTMPHAAGMNFKTIDGSERSVLTQSKLNQDQVNQSGKKASDTTTMLNSQEVKSRATHSQIAQDNKKEGNTIRETSKNWNPIGKDTPIILTKGFMAFCLKIK